MSLQSKVALRAVFIALAMVFSWIEAQIPYPIPGAKLGLTNLVVLTALYCLNIRDAIGINIVRILLTGLTFGSMFSLIYSLAGGMLSSLIMILMKQTGKFRITAVSLAGGIMHNVGQILVAMYVLETRAMITYLPVLWITGMSAGIIVGLLGGMVLKRIPKKLSDGRGWEKFR